MPEKEKEKKEQIVVVDEYPQQQVYQMPAKEGDGVITFIPKREADTEMLNSIREILKILRE